MWDEVTEFTQAHWDYLIQRVKLLGEQMDYGSLQAANSPYVDQQMAKLDKPVTIRQELIGTIKGLEERIANKKAMLELLDRNPDIEKFMDLSRS